MERKIFNDVTAIKIKLHLKGRGIVNYDSHEQLWGLKQMGLLTGRPVTKNCKVSKKNCKILGQDENGNDVYGFHHIISSDCLRHIIFDEIRPDTKLQFIPNLFYTAITSIPYLVRGYMFTGNHIPVKKKTLLCLTDAEEIGEFHKSIDLQLHSRSGNKNDAFVAKESEEQTQDIDEDDSSSAVNDKGNTSLFFREHIGDIEYECEGFFDVKEAQFISADVLFDRDAVGMGLADNDKNSVNNRGLYMLNLDRNLGSEHKLDFYYMASSLFGDEYGEQGILLTRNEVNNMVHYVLDKLLNLSYSVNGGYVETSSLGIEVIQAGVNEPVSIKIDKNANFSNLVFNYKQEYVEAREDKILANKAEAERLQVVMDAAKKQAAKEKAAKSKKGK